MYPPNDLRYLRFQNTLNPPDMLQGETMDVPAMQNQPAQNVGGQDNSSYYEEQLKNLMENFPKREEPGLGRKILAVVNAIRTPPAHMQEVYDETKYPDYYRGLQDWKNKAGLIEKGSGFENTRVLRNIQQGQLTERVRSDKEKESDREVMRARQQQDSDTRSYNAAINDYKSKNPNHVFKFVGSQVIGFDPAAGADSKGTVMTDANGIPLDTGKVDDTTRMHMQLQNKLAEIHASGNEAVRTEGVRQGGRTNLAGVKFGFDKSLENIRQGNKIDLEKTKITGRKDVNANRPSASKDAQGRTETTTAVEDKGSAGLFGWGARPKTKTTTKVVIPAPKGQTTANAPIRKEIPGHPGKFAISADGGKTWKAE